MTTRLPIKLRPAQLPPPPPEPEPDDEGHELQMGFFDHLDELRKRLTWALLALVIGTTISFFFTSPVLKFIQVPYCQAVPEVEDCRLQTLGPTENVISYFRVSLMMGGILAIPIITYQLMMFIVPGLTKRERRYVLTSMPAITFLFLVGAGFAWFIMTPPALDFLQNFESEIFKPEWTAELYLAFVTALVFWMGVAFETPLVFFVLSLLGLVGPRLLIKNWRVAIVVAAIAAAVITPTVDPVNMFLVMGPLLTLYTLSILLVTIGRRMSRVDAPV